MEQKIAPATPFEAKVGQTFLCTKVEIATERILLLPISDNYAGEIFQNFTTEVTRYMFPQPPGRIKETLEFISTSREGMRRGENLQFVIVDKKSGEFLGCCGLHGHGNPAMPELGIWLKVTAHGNGYGKEAIIALVQWADHYLKYDYLTYPVDRDNIPSRKIPESLGGEIFEEALCPRQDGEFLDILIYRIYPGSREAFQPVSTLADKLEKTK